MQPTRHAPKSAPAALPTRLPLTPARLLSTPLPELLAELGVESFPSTIREAGFFGALVQGSDGHLVLTQPGQNPVAEDTLARAMLGRVFGVPLAPLPDCLEMSVY